MNKRLILAAALLAAFLGGCASDRTESPTSQPSGESDPAHRKNRYGEPSQPMPPPPPTIGPRGGLHQY